MRIRNLRTTAVGMTALVLSLTGCGGGDSMPTLPPTPSATPIFASEEEALDAAEEAYAAYSEVSDAISNEGGVSPERIAPYVSAEQLTRELETARYFEERGWRTVGRPTITEFDLQQYTETSGMAEVVTYICTDVSNVRVVDSEGADVTPSDRDELALLEVVFVGNSSDRLVVDRSEWWPDSSSC